MRGRDILPIDSSNLRISSHALERFAMRVGVTLSEAATQIRPLLAEARLINKPLQNRLSDILIERNKKRFIF